LLVSGTILFVIGERLAEQLSQLSTQVPDAWARAKLMLQQSHVGRSLLDGLASSGSALSSRIGSFASGTLGALANTGLVLFLGLFMAADPELYRCGLLRLVPLRARARCGMALVEAGHALKRWLLGQLIAMICVGALTGLGLWALGVPLALSLGILAGALDFVPYIGPIAAALPAVLLGFTQNPTTALYVALLYAAVQQIEGNVIVPLAQRWAVSLPPALAIVSVIVFGLIFGLPGLLFATPLMVVIIILVRKLYVEGVLEQSSDMSSGPGGSASG
jgi:predicted PurR-regulated permease PerM